MKLVEKCKIAWLRWRHPNLEQLTAEAKECYAKANAAAIEDGVEFITSCHLLVAVLRAPSLDRLDPEQSILNAASQAPLEEVSKYADPLKTALEQSIEIAREKKLRNIDPKLLLLGMMRLKELNATKIIKDHGLGIDQTEEATKGNA